MVLLADPRNSRPWAPELQAADPGTPGHPGPGLTYGEATDDLDQKHRQDAWLQQQAGDGLQIKHAGLGFPWGMRRGRQPTGQWLNAPSPLPRAQHLPPRLPWLAVVLAKCPWREGGLGVSGAPGPGCWLLGSEGSQLTLAASRRGVPGGCSWPAVSGRVHPAGRPSWDTPCVHLDQHTSRGSPGGVVWAWALAPLVLAGRQVTLTKAPRRVTTRAAMSGH